MPGTPTPRLLLPIPDEDDPADVPVDLTKLATALDSGGSGSIPGGVAYDNQGSISARPAAGVRGRYYFATDNGQLARDTGTAWIPIIPAVTPTLPLNPIVGQEAYWAIVDPYTNIYALWHMRCQSANLWGFVGGPPIYSLNLTGYNGFNSAAWFGGLTPPTYTPQYAGYFDVTVGMSANFSGVAGNNGSVSAAFYDFTAGTIIAWPITAINASAYSGGGGSQETSGRTVLQPNHQYGVALTNQNQVVNIGPLWYYVRPMGNVTVPAP